MKHYMYFSKHSIYIKIHKYTPESFIKDIPPGVLFNKTNNKYNRKYKNGITIVKSTMTYQRAKNILLVLITT